jgi:4-diphosphocytidyl-2-C-methyl-D-erythritol kinase
MTEYTEAAPAKVNLYLRIVGKRADGYHLLDSLAVFAGVGDRLSAQPADDLTLVLDGPFGASLNAEPDNLVLRAARALAGQAGIQPRARLTLDKHLPVASGIGGGSADAAATLRLLCRFWNLAPPRQTLMKIAAGLGADVPVCLAGSPARMGGIGEVLETAPQLPSYGLVLVNPGRAVSTVAVFRARTGGFSAPVDLPDRWTDAADMAAGLADLGNDLQAAAAALCPEIAQVLTAIAAAPGCRLARMSGSGATCFGLFDDASAARNAASGLVRPGWWVDGSGGCRSIPVPAPQM